MTQSIIREPLLTAMLAAGTAVERVEVARIELGPAQQTGLHFHPCPVAGTVVSGTIRFQVEGEEERTLQAGDAFFEPANTRIANFDNQSDDETAMFVAFYLLPEGEERLIVMAE
jgi:quercetin dioxygenase-like cupin family protein